MGTYISSFININSSVPDSFGGEGRIADTHTQAAWRSHKPILGKKAEKSRLMKSP
jgi:hypothetical protein